MHAHVGDRVAERVAERRGEAAVERAAAAARGGDRGLDRRVGDAAGQDPFAVLHAREQLRRSCGCRRSRRADAGGVCSRAAGRGRLDGGRADVLEFGDVGFQSTHEREHTGLRHPACKCPVRARFSASRRSGCSASGREAGPVDRAPAMVAADVGDEPAHAVVGHELAVAEVLDHAEEHEPAEVAPAPELPERHVLEQQRRQRERDARADREREEQRGRRGVEVAEQEAERQDDVADRLDERAEELEQDEERQAEHPDHAVARVADHAPVAHQRVGRGRGASGRAGRRAGRG